MARRTVVLAAATLALTGCGVRLESDAPAFLPTPAPDPAGAPILAERARVSAVLDEAARLLISPVADRLHRIHVEQLAALDSALASLDPPVPAPASTPNSSSRASGAASGTTTPATPQPSLAPLARLEYAGLDRAGLAALDDLPPRAASLVVASHAQRSLSLYVLRRARVPGTGTMPAAPWVAADGALALQLVEAIRAAAYGLEVAAAQSAPPKRSPLLGGLRLLRSAETEIGAAVPDLPPRPLGYVLPHPVRDATQAARLTDTVLTRLGTAAITAAAPTAAALSVKNDNEELSPRPTTATSTSGPAPAASSRPAVPTGPAGAMAALVRLTTLAEVTRLDAGGNLRALPALNGESGGGTATPSPTDPGHRPSDTSRP